MVVAAGGRGRRRAAGRGRRGRRRSALSATARPRIEPASGCCADRVRLRQVLVNLLSNAVKYNRPGGSVTRRAGRRGAERWHLRIADTGVGMAPEKLARLFEPFNRLGAENSNIEGTGIGLVLSRRLVEMMERRAARSTSTLGRGTDGDLGRWQGRPTRRRRRPRRAVAAEPARRRSTVGLRVLYAEDNEVNVELVRQVVTLRPSVALRVAENGALALEMARRDPPDLMLVDMNLGDMTGIELAQALRDEPGDGRHPPGRAVGRRAARADRRGARGGLRELSDQADRLPQAARRPRRATAGRGRGHERSTTESPPATDACYTSRPIRRSHRINAGERA